MMTKFKADFRLHEITPIKITKCTDFTYEVGDGYKYKMKGSGYVMCNTYEAAKIELIKNCERGIELYASMLETELKQLKNTMEL